MNNKKALLLSIMIIAIFTVSGCQKNENVEEIIIGGDNNVNSEKISQETETTESTENEITEEKSNENISDKKDSTKKNKETKDENQEKNNAFTYESKKYNFSIEIPNTWKFQEEEYNFAVLLSTPKDDEINENLGISVQTPQIKTELESYYSSSMKKIEEISENFKEISSKDFEVNGLKGKNTIYESTQGDTIVKSQQTVFIDDNNKVYILQYTATKNTFDKYLNKINEIINSFTLLN